MSKRLLVALACATALVSGGMGVGATLLIAEKGPAGEEGPRGPKGPRGASGESAEDLSFEVSDLNSRLADLEDDLQRLSGFVSGDIEELADVVDATSQMAVDNCAVLGEQFVCSLPGYSLNTYRYP